MKRNNKNDHSEVNIKEKLYILENQVTDESSFLEYLEFIATIPCDNTQEISEDGPMAGRLLQKTLEATLRGLQAHSAGTIWYNEYQAMNPWRKMAALLGLGLVYD